MAQIKMRLRLDDKATTGTNFHIELGDNSYMTISEREGSAVANKCLEYGYRVYLQKDIGEGQSKIEGKRDAEAVSTHLKAKGFGFTTSEWVKGATSEDTRLSMVKEAGLSADELAELIAEAKARKANG